MDAVRARVGTALEWILAAAFLMAAASVGSLMVGQLRAVMTPAPPISTIAPVLLAPASIPARAISVPLVLLADGKEVRLGDTEFQIAALLGRAAETGAQRIERRGLRELLTRFYEYAGTRFALVFEQRDRAAETRVAAIYVQ